MKKIWSGGASDASGPDLSSLMTDEDNEVDSYLLKYEINGLIAYHLELSKWDIIPKEETKEILAALIKLVDDNIKMGKEYEDVHSMVEDKVKGVTDAGKDLRIFLSRNDQSHYDIRSFYIDELLEVASLLVNLAGRVKNEFSAVSGYMAGYTHYRQAMPVSFETYFDYISGVFLNLAEDAHNLSKKFSKSLPLGYGSGYGSELPIDKMALASTLGFEEMFGNPMYGAFYRGIDDMDVSFLATKIMVSISRLAQDLITLSSEEYGAINLPSGYTTGSSLMPNKRNPDFLEMVEGYASEAIGTLVSSSTTLMNKGSGYHREFQLSKDKVMKYTLRLIDILKAMDGLFSGMEINVDQAEKLVENSTHATMEVFRLFSGGMKWKDAYTTVGNMIKANEPFKTISPKSLTTINTESIYELSKAMEMEKKRREDLIDSLHLRARKMLIE